VAGIIYQTLVLGSGGGGVDAAQVVELQSQLSRARAQIVRLEDGFHEAMVRSSVQGALPQGKARQTLLAKFSNAL